MVEVIGQVPEVPAGDVDGTARGAGGVDAVARRRVGETGDAPHLVVGGEMLDQRQTDQACRSGDKNLPTLHAHAPIDGRLRLWHNVSGTHRSGRPPALLTTQVRVVTSILRHDIRGRRRRR